jgi:hypothetical protein
LTLQKKNPLEFFSFDRLTLNSRSSSPAANLLSSQQEKMLHATNSSMDGNEQMA